MRGGFGLVLVLAAGVVQAEVVCEETDDEITVRRDGRHVLSYQKVAEAPEGVEAKWARSGFIHPVTTPSGRVVTDGYPVPHHSHQHGIFFAWRKASFQGEAVNFWEHGRDTVRHDEVLEIVNEEGRAGFRVALEHVRGEQTVLRETWEVMVDAGTGHIDFRSEQRCGTKSPLVLEKFHYGAMAVRGSRQWFRDAHTSAGKGAVKDEFVEACEIVTSEGLTQEDGNHSRPRWVAMSGPVDGAPVSLALIPHPTNFRYPQAVRLHPKMPYFCFVPTVEKPARIEPGIPLVSRYRIVVGDGELDLGQLDAVQGEYAGTR